MFTQNTLKEKAAVANTANNYWKRLEEKLVGIHADSIHSKIEKQVPFLEKCDWYIQDHKLGTSLYLIGAKTKIAAFQKDGIVRINQVQEKPYWSGLIVDIENPNIRIHDFYPGKRIVTKTPLNFDNTLKIEDYEFESFSIFGFLDYPIVRIWEYEGEIMFSSSERIDAKDYSKEYLERKKSYGTIFTKLGGKYEIQNKDYVFYYQLVSEFVPTYTIYPSINFIQIIEVKTKLGIPISYHIPMMDIETANNYLFPKNMEGNTVILFTNKGHFHLHSYQRAWRESLLGFNYTVHLRYFELCDARFLSVEAIKKIFGIEIESKEQILFEISKLYNNILPIHLREEFYEKYWGKDGVIHKFKDFLQFKSKLEQERKTKLSNYEIKAICLFNQGKTIDSEEFYGSIINHILNKYKQHQKLENKHKDKETIFSPEDFPNLK